MKIDLLLDPFGARWADVRRVAVDADRAGIDGLWTWDHLAGSVHGADRVLECWTVLTAVATCTERVALGPLVLNVANRHPGVLAVMAATLQEVAGGRLLLGLGAGGADDTPYGPEQRFLGRPAPADPARRAQVRDAVATLREVWGGSASGAGGFLTPSPPPPVVIAGFGSKMAALAGDVGDGFNTSAGHPGLRELCELARRRHAEGARAAEPFLTTAFASLDPRWYGAGGGGRRRALEAGVDRLVLLAAAPYPDRARLDEIVAAAGPSATTS
jgi:alkanesulfonate monooxygenase SsuD/methylene tetrahydromethanopterin reductase-like flavin-dependent oxidoreductase (luciferase family)